MLKGRLILSPRRLVSITHSWIGALGVFAAFGINALAAESASSSVVATTSNDQMEAFAASHGDFIADLTPESPPSDPLPIDIQRLKPGFVPGAEPLISRESPESDVAPVAAVPTLTASFIGQIDDTVSIPPHMGGAVGLNHVCSFLKAGRTIFNKTGSVVSSTITMQAFWSSLGTGSDQPAENPGSPRVLYDQYTNRWIVACTCYGTSNSWVLVGMSLTDNPAGAWNLYAIQANTGLHAGHYIETPALGLDPNNVVITGNLRMRGTQTFQHSDVYVINKARLPLGLPLVLGVDYTIIHNPCSAVGVNNTFMPCHTFDQTALTGVNYVLDQGWFDTGDPTLRFVRISPIVGVGAAAIADCLANENFVRVACYNFNKLDATQPNACPDINTNTTALTSTAVVRNGRIFFTHHVGSVPAACPNALNSPPATRSEIRWYEVDPAEIVTPGLPRQQGAVGHSSLAYYYPSIAVNQSGGVMLGFSGSDAATFPGAFYTSRMATDTPGTMQGVAVLKAGEDTYRKTLGATSARNRWGDYSSTVVDPSDQQTMWTIQEYARPQVGGTCSTDNTGRWGTWWGSVRYSPVCATCRGDANGDNRENAADISKFVSCYLWDDGFAAGCGCCDLNEDAKVDNVDLSLFVSGLLNIGIGDPSDVCP